MTVSLPAEEVAADTARRHQLLSLGPFLAGMDLVTFAVGVPALQTELNDLAIGRVVL